MRTPVVLRCFRLCLAFSQPVLSVGIIVVGCLLTSQTVSRGAEENSGVFYHSPGGSYDIDFIEVNGANQPFVVSTENRAERALLPDAVAEWDATEVTLRFHASPDEKWILNTESWRHHGVQGQELYQVKSGVTFEPFKEKEWFTKAVRAYAIENGGFRDTDFLAQRGENVYENHLIARFHGWSFDSSRLLIGISGDFREDRGGPFYVYFNTRTKSFEQTPYLRKWNNIVANSDSNSARHVLCSEPVEPLPPEEKLKARLHALESKLKAIYTQRLTTRKEGVADELREEQQAWLKARDEGVNIYLAFAPKGEMERRRLQFLADVTAARIEDFQPVWK